MYRPIIISLFLIVLLMTSTILPFTSIDKFSNNTAMAQEMGYYDQEYNDYNSDIKYNSDDETYTDYQDGNKKYECRTGPFEGFFVSSPEFCKNVKLDDDKDDRKKDDSRDNNTNNNKTGTPNQPSQNGTLDAKFSELRLVTNPNDLVILDGSGSTGTITSWSIVQIGGQPSVTLQDVPSKQYSKQFIMPNTNDTLLFDLTVTNNQTGQRDTATILVISNQALQALDLDETCSGGTPDLNQGLKSFHNPANNYTISYPSDFFLGQEGNSVFLTNDEIPQRIPGNQTIFSYDILPDPDCISDSHHHLQVDILQMPYNDISSGISEFIQGELLRILWSNFNIPANRVFEPISPSAPTSGEWITSQGNRGNSLDFTVVKRHNVTGESEFLQYRVFYVIIDKFIYFLAYSIDQPPLHDNFEIFYNSKVRHMVESLCFTSQPNKPCTANIPPSSGITVTEEWRNFDYKEIPGKPDFYKVFIKSTEKGSLLKFPENIIEVNPFAGINCIANPTGCDLGKNQPFVTLQCINPLGCDVRKEIPVLIYQPPRVDGSGYKEWTALSASPHTWILDKLVTPGPGGVIVTNDMEEHPLSNVKFTADVLGEGKRTIEGKFFLQLFKTTICDVNNPPCQVIPGPTFNLKGPYTVVGPDVHTGIFVTPGAVVHISARGLVDFGSGFFLGIGAPILGPDGDNEITPFGYPDQTLRKNSLIVKIGNEFYQGGTSTSFTSTTSGEIILLANDADITDNSRGWSVSLTVN
ncbi:MAG: hypothetical protein K0S93_497 [Nitrososphaeraceae archaeon]|nr:hypothetical protein [Nitrososphaeraceae archaeon]